MIRTLVRHSGRIWSEFTGIWITDDSENSGRAREGGAMTVSSTGTISVLGFGIDDDDEDNLALAAIRAEITSKETSDGVTVNVSDRVLSSLGYLSRTILAEHYGKGSITVTVGSADGDGPRIRTLGEAVNALIAPNPGTAGNPTKSPIVVNFLSGEIDAGYRGIGAWYQGHGENIGVAGVPIVQIVSSGNIRVGKKSGIEALRKIATEVLDLDGNGTLTTAEKGLLKSIMDEATVAGTRADFTNALGELIGLANDDNYNDVYEELAIGLYDCATKLREVQPRHETQPRVTINYADEVFHGYWNVGIYAQVNSAFHISDDINLAGDELDDAAANEVGDNEHERAIFNAVITGAAEIPEEMFKAFADDSYRMPEYKASVRALLNRYNVGDIKIDVKGGTIISEGDGVVAAFGRFDNRNGAIDISVAEGGPSFRGTVRIDTG